MKLKSFIITLGKFIFSLGGYNSTHCFSMDFAYLDD